MDPYRILGVPRGCTREEVKEAFRVKVQRAHPDRGGEDLSFIQLRAAYERILAEIDRRRGPTVPTPGQAPRNRRPPKPPDPSRDADLVMRDVVPRNDRPPKPPDPNWNPDLVLVPKPPEPGWDPDLIVLPKPQDPAWKPDLVVHEETPRPVRPPGPPDPEVTRGPYLAWFRRVADRSLRRDPMWRWRWLRTVGFLILLGAIVAYFWFCWIVWIAINQMEAEARRTGY
jgi:hypothetical protein